MHLPCSMSILLTDIEHVLDPFVVFFRQHEYVEQCILIIYLARFDHPIWLIHTLSFEGVNPLHYLIELISNMVWIHFGLKGVFFGSNKCDPCCTIQVFYSHIQCQEQCWLFVLLLFRNLADPHPLIRECRSARLRKTIKIG